MLNVKDFYELLDMRRRMCYTGCRSESDPSNDNRRMHITCFDAKVHIGTSVIRWGASADGLSPSENLCVPRPPTDRVGAFFCPHGKEAL